MSEEKFASPSDDVGAENEPESPISGPTRTLSMGSYPKLSKLMGSYPDVALFRKFGDLNAQNLLFLQAELTHLEEKLKFLRFDELRSEDPKALQRQQSWWSLSGNADDDEEPSQEWEIIREIREKLKEYSMASIFEALCSECWSDFPHQMDAYPNSL